MLKLYLLLGRDPMLLVLYIIYCFFLLLSALFTGLNLSLMSLDIDDLRRIKEYDEDPKTRRYAANIIPIRENGNFILCTILFGSEEGEVAETSAIDQQQQQQQQRQRQRRPVPTSRQLKKIRNNICNIICVLTFDQMFSHLRMSEFDRILFINIVPAMFTVTFAEVIPQVIFTKYALSMGSRFRYLMVFFIVITFPASYPLAKLLDLIVGREMRTTMDKRILGGLIRQQKYENENMADVVENAMNLQVRRVRDVMTPLEKVFMISDKTEVNSNLKKELNANRHTRIPVFKGDDRNCFRFVSSETPVAQLMLELKKGFPLAIVVDYHHDKMNYSVVGIVTLEDNLEEVIGEIYDEKDLKLKNRSGEKIDEKSVAVDASAGVAADGLTLKMSKKKKHTGLSTEELLPDEHAPLLTQGAASSMKK
ncbi:unnamed protein product [Angiostrongylus costaricensis]|uniref:CNNM transmembrane domain-containing protein n=1 Tax=Angiostrongylus costaricensis TaxID=334426 RepID=A0A158PDV0_ANGCS|nr:unnamed protein product [Angiostrongylus costaricensis]